MTPSFIWMKGDTSRSATTQTHKTKAAVCEYCVCVERPICMCASFLVPSLWNSPLKHTQTRATHANENENESVVVHCHLTFFILTAGGICTNKYVSVGAFTLTLTFVFMYRYLFNIKTRRIFADALPHTHAHMYANGCMCVWQWRRIPDSQAESSFVHIRTFMEIY